MNELIDFVVSKDGTKYCTGIVCNKKQFCFDDSVEPAAGVTHGEAVFTHQLLTDTSQSYCSTETHTHTHKKKANSCDIRV